MILPSLLNPMARKIFDGLAQRVALAGEPFQTFFDPSCLEVTLTTMGFGKIDNVGPQEMDDRYFRGRTDNLRAGSLARMVNAQV